MQATATFAFSDEELLDALTTVSDDSGDFTAFDKAFLASGSAEEVVLRRDPFALPNSSITSDLIAASTAPVAHQYGQSVGTNDTTPSDSSSEPSSLFECEALPLTSGSQPKRKRQKHELDHFRALATSLESQLTSLRQRYRPENPGTNLFWKRVADQLLLDRQRATTENARLKDIYQDQFKVLNAIQKSILKSPDLEKLGVAPSPSLSQPLDALHSSEIYSRLFQDVTDAYSGTDSVLEQAGVKQATETKRKVNMSMTSENGHSVLTMEVAESVVIPFHAARVAESAWSILTASTCGLAGDMAFNRLFKTSGNDVFGICKIDCPLGLYTLNSDVAVRRFIEGDRLTYVWECVGRCDHETDPSSSFRMREKGWVVFEPSPVDPLKQSIFRSCVQFVPMPMDPSQELGTAAKDVGLATEIALSVYEKTIGYIHNCVLSELTGGTTLE